LNAAQVLTPLGEALLEQGAARQSIPFNTQAALQKQMFADAFLPNSSEFDIALNGEAYVAQRAEDPDTGEVRVYYAPATDFNAVRFVER
jgi:hypothetical protein